MEQLRHSTKTHAMKVEVCTSVYLVYRNVRAVPFGFCISFKAIPHDARILTDCHYVSISLPLQTSFTIYNSSDPAVLNSAFPPRISNRSQGISSRQRLSHFIDRSPYLRDTGVSTVTSSQETVLCGGTNRSPVFQDKTIGWLSYEPFGLDNSASEFSLATTTRWWVFVRRKNFISNFYII